MTNGHLDPKTIDKKKSENLFDFQFVCFIIIKTLFLVPMKNKNKHTADVLVMQRTEKIIFPFLPNCSPNSILFQISYLIFDLPRWWNRKIVFFWIQKNIPSSLVKNRSINIVNINPFYSGRFLIWFKPD